MEKHLILTFTTNDKKDFKLSLSNPKENVTKEMILPIAEKIIETKIFNSKKHTLLSFKNAKYVLREETIIN